jgi:hypothetical protein
MGWLYTIKLITEYENKKVYKFGKTDKINPWHRIKQYVRFEKPDKIINLSFVEDTNIEDKILIELKKDTHLNFISEFGFEWFNCEDEEYLYKIIATLISKYSKIKLNESYNKKSYYLTHINPNNEKITNSKEMWWGCGNDIMKMKWLKEIGCPYPKQIWEGILTELDNLKWLFNNIPIELFNEYKKPYTFQIAATTGNLELLKYLKEKNVQWDTKTFHNAITKENLNILVWLKENKCPWNKSSYKRGLKTNNNEIIRFLVNSGCPH